MASSTQHCSLVSLTAHSGQMVPLSELQPNETFTIAGKVPEPPVRGRIGIYTTVWCACGHWVNLTAKTRTAAAVEARTMGWKKDRKKSWLCWCCQGALTTHECGRRCG